MSDTSSRARCGRLGLCIAASVLIFGALPAQSQSKLTKGSATDSVRVGAYDPYGTFANDAKLAIEHVFIPWQDVDLPSLKLADQYASLRNRSLLITMEPWSWSRSSKSVVPSDLHAEIIAGRYDNLIRAFCEMSGSLKSRITIRWAQEMDLANKRYPWSHWTPTEYIAAYRHFVNVCRSVASNAKFMWSPRGEDEPAGLLPWQRLRRQHWTFRFRLSEVRNCRLRQDSVADGAVDTVLSACGGL